MRRLAALVVLFLIAACGGQSGLSLPIGTCFDDQDEVEVTLVAEVDCSEPHDNEVFALAESPTGTAEYPGHDVLNDYGFNVCVVQFEAYVGISYLESELDVFPILPTESSWNEQEDRDIICALHALNSSKLTGSMRGSAR